MIRTEKRLRLCYTLLILNLCFIWGNSLLPGELSGAFSNWVKDILAALLPGDGESVGGGGLLRKLAHFTEFACLGAFLTRFLFLLNKSRKKSLFFPEVNPMSIPMKITVTCPKCGKSHDIDYPKCPNCKYNYLE